jgi:hypothetical protein
LPDIVDGCSMSVRSVHRHAFGSPGLQHAWQ